MNTSADLQVEIGAPGEIILRRGPMTNDINWSRVRAVFSSSRLAGDDSSTVTISLLSFEAKASWLPIWVSDGLTVSWSDEVAELLRKVREQTTAFTSTTQLDPERHKGGAIEVPGLQRTLTQQQAENILCLLDLPNGSNFSVPGAGKTLTTLALWRILVTNNQLERLLVVCPRSAIESWKQESANSFEVEIPYEVFDGNHVNPQAKMVLVNFEQLENVHKLEKVRAWVRNRKTLLVIDEAHRIKGGGRSVRWIACKSLAESAERVEILTGTPMPNGPADLQALFALTWPLLKNESAKTDRYSSMKRNTVFVRTTKDELGLPPVSYVPILGTPSNLHRDILEALRDSYKGVFGLSVLDERMLTQKGKAVMTLLAAATNPGLLIAREFSEIEFGFSWPPNEISEDHKLTKLITNYLDFDMPWKFRQVVDLVGQASKEEEKVIVWSSFVGNLAAMKRYLKAFKPAVVYGGTPSEEREAELSRFREDPSCKVLLTNPQTLGEGISLHETSSRAIYVDRTFNAGHFLQSVDRIHRLGLPRDRVTTIYLLQTAGSIDQRVADRLDAKITNLAKFLQDPALRKTAIPSAEEIPAEDALGLDDADFAEIMSFLSEK